MELGALSLSDLQTDPATGAPFDAEQRLAEIVSYAELADRLGLDAFALGEHHTLDFAVSSPAVVLAAIAARTNRIRLSLSGRRTVDRIRPAHAACVRWLSIYPRF
jgi:alkanesulfonate monooxygenase SsuD/methylene tetrahydromethanopterin reductase-like flavin-dependent oxidoreductase (luciferase family)